MSKPGAFAEWKRIREEANHCRACDLWRPAEQTVFGEGPTRAPYAAFVAVLGLARPFAARSAA